MDPCQSANNAPSTKFNPGFELPLQVVQTRVAVPGSLHFSSHNTGLYLQAMFNPGPLAPCLMGLWFFLYALEPDRFGTGDDRLPANKLPP